MQVAILNSGNEVKSKPILFYQLVAVTGSAWFISWNDYNSSCTTIIMVILSNILFLGDMFVNYDLKKSLNIFKLGSQGVAEVCQLTIGNKETAYQYIEWVNIGIV